MTKALDPEIKALRGIVRALEPLDAAETKRSLEWLVSRECGLPWIELPPIAEPAAGVVSSQETPQ